MKNKKTSSKGKKAQGALTVDILAVFGFVLVVIIFIILFQIAGCTADKAEMSITAKMQKSALLSGFLPTYLRTPITVDNHDMTMGELIALSEDPNYRRVMRLETQKILSKMSDGIGTNFAVQVNFSDDGIILFTNKDVGKVLSAVVPRHNGSLIQVDLIEKIDTNDPSLGKYAGMAPKMKSEDFLFTIADFVDTSNEGDFVLDKTTGKVYVFWKLKGIWFEEGKPCQTTLILDVKDGTLVCRNKDPISEADALCFKSTSDILNMNFPSCQGGGSGAG